MSSRPLHTRTARRAAADPNVAQLAASCQLLATNQRDSVQTMTAFRERMRMFARVALSQDQGDAESGMRAMLVGWRTLMGELGRASD